RRHTRFDCDWSSDVCSSDLLRYLDTANDATHSRYNGFTAVKSSSLLQAPAALPPLRGFELVIARTHQRYLSPGIRAVFGVQIVPDTFGPNSTADLFLVTSSTQT